MERRSSHLHGRYLLKHVELADLRPGQKIKDLDELATFFQDLKAHGKRIVHCHGVFDLIHIGHIHHFEEARKMGDILVVTLTPDRYVNKGPHRPAFPEQLRASSVAALEVVDYVAINRWPSSVETIQLLKPDIYVKGAEFKNEQDLDGAIARESAAIRAIGGEMRFTDDRIVFSSSNLLNRYWSPFTEEVDRYLESFRQRHSLDEVLEWLDCIASLRPIVVGEAIIDEYLFCEGLGKSTKDPVLAVLQTSVETYPGGTLAVANHLAGLCDHVQLVTQVGETERREEFVRNILRTNVEPVLLTKSDSPTIHKRRIVDQYSTNKLLEVYMMNDQPTSGKDAEQLYKAIEQALPAHDVAVVADYGHGMLTSNAIELICDTAPFLAVNVQSNAGNHGFNPISKYRRADYVCLAAHEIDIETRRREGDMRDRLLEVSKRIDCPRFTVTLGKSGSLHYQLPEGFTEVPALATRVLDRVGAGDAVFAITSLLAKMGAPWDIIGFIGNAAGAQLVAELGNRASLDRVALSKHITALMK